MNKKKKLIIYRKISVILFLQKFYRTYNNVLRFPSTLPFSKRLRLLYRFIWQTFRWGFSEIQGFRLTAIRNVYNHLYIPLFCKRTTFVLLDRCVYDRIGGTSLPAQSVELPRIDNSKSETNQYNHAVLGRDIPRRKYCCVFLVDFSWYLFLSFDCTTISC